MQSVFCCGGNAFYQLGLGDYEDRYKLISLNELIYSQIPPKDKINKIFSGNEHTFILTKQHSILVCGENEYGQLGLGDFKDRTHFEHFNFFKQEQFTNNKEFIIEIFCGNGHTLFLTNKGMVYGCGWNFFGQLGIRFGKNSTSVPIKLNIENIKKITGGNEYSIFITKDYKIYGSGYNKGGNLGTGNNLNQYTLHNIPFFNNLENEHVIDVACGAEQTFFLTNLGNVFACGQNYHLQLGILKKSSFSVPTKLNIENVKNVYCGSFHTLFLLKGNELYGCGANSYKYSQLLYIGGDIQNAITLVTPGIVKEINFHYTKLSMTNERNEIFLLKQDKPTPRFDQITLNNIKLKKVFSGLSNKIYFTSTENKMYSVETDGGVKVEQLKSKTSLNQQFIYIFSGFNFAYVIASHSPLFVNGFSSAEVDRMKKVMLNQLKVNNKCSDVIISLFE
ncbi:hypothetical protein ABK040_009301 [Willaertia magna]